LFRGMNGKRAAPEGGDGGGGRKKRKQVMPRLHGVERCGHCHTCLNPSMKKACLTRRAELQEIMAEEEKKEERKERQEEAFNAAKEHFADVKKRAEGGGESGSGDGEKFLPSKWVAKVVDMKGFCLRPEHAQRFVKVCGNFAKDPAEHMEAISGLLLIMGVTRSPEAQIAMVNKGVCAPLADWLGKLVEGKWFFLAGKILKQLKRLPFTKAIADSGIVKVLKEFRKKCPEEEESLARDSKEVLDKWKKAFKQSDEEAKKAAAAPAGAGEGGSPKSQAAAIASTPSTSKSNGEEENREKKKEVEPVASTSAHHAKPGDAKAAATAAAAAAPKVISVHRSRGAAETVSKAAASPGPSSPSSSAAVRKKRKKSVTWKPEEYLVQVRHYVPDPSSKWHKNFGAGGSGSKTREVTKEEAKKEREAERKEMLALKVNTLKALKSPAWAWRPPRPLVETGEELKWQLTKLEAEKKGRKEEDEREKKPEIQQERKDEAPPLSSPAEVKEPPKVDLSAVLMNTALLANLNRITGSRSQPQAQFTGSRPQPQAQFTGGLSQPQTQFTGGRPQPQAQFRGGLSQPQAQFTGGRPQPQAQFRGGLSQPQAQFTGGRPQPQAQFRGGLSQPQAQYWNRPQVSSHSRCIFSLSFPSLSLPDLSNRRPISSFFF